MLDYIKIHVDPRFEQNRSKWTPEMFIRSFTCSLDFVIFCPKVKEHEYSSVWCI